jgi:hypothetical protein
MKNVPSLPPNYTLQSSYDLKSPQLNWIIQLIFLVIAGIMVGAAFLFAWIPASSLHGLVVAAITIGLVLVYMSLHELTHGVVLSLLSKTPFRYAFRFPFLTTGSTSYYNKKSFILVLSAKSLYCSWLKRCRICGRLSPSFPGIQDETRGFDSR